MPRRVRKRKLREGPHRAEPDVAIPGYEAPGWLGTVQSLIERVFAVPPELIQRIAKLLKG
jgi:hypothetical protein